MIYIHWRENKPCRTVYRVSIDKEDRERFSDQQLINIVDANADLSKADVKENYGGVVKQLAGEIHRVDVYTD